MKTGEKTMVQKRGRGSFSGTARRVFCKKEPRPLFCTLVLVCLAATRAVPLDIGFVANLVRAAELEDSAAGRQLRVAYVYDAAGHATANREGRNHWDLYLR